MIFDWRIFFLDPRSAGAQLAQFIWKWMSIVSTSWIWLEQAFAKMAQLKLAALCRGDAAQEWGALQSVVTLRMVLQRIVARHFADVAPDDLREERNSFLRNVVKQCLNLITLTKLATFILCLQNFAPGHLGSKNPVKKSTELTTKSK